MTYRLVAFGQVANKTAVILMVVPLLNIVYLQEVNGSS